MGITVFCFENKMAAFEKIRNLVRVSRLFKGNKNVLSEASSRNGSTQTPFRKRTQEELSAYVKEIESRSWKSKEAAPWNRKLDSFHYKRDFSLRDWGRREAMIIMLEREEAGLHYIDRNFVDPSKLDLPSDEELGDAPVYL